ncbi:MAG: hypothetical protein KBA54_02445 [Candidatus Cloacimonetes bacterium]|nr:hypothetical protein [Candidatus Cloacimonadota bacterium]
MRTALISIFVLIAGAACGLALPDSREPVLTDANLLTGFLRVTPDDKVPETLPTKAWLWQDGSDLMVHFEAAIDSTFTQGSLTVKDEGTTADYLRVQLITIPDAYYAYYYVAFPLGNLQDGVRGSDMSIDLAWNSHYSYTSQHSDSLWTVTMRIPLGELRFKQDKPYRWKIILHRNLEDSQDFYALPYSNTKMGKDYFLKAQDIVLPNPVQHQLDIALKPYFVKSYDLISRSASWDPDHVGLDLALNPGQRTRIKVSLNPDFSDTPMDSAQDDYNSKYPPYYDENRFFFTEDIDAFGIDYDVLNTRNIVQPRFAFKATGNSRILNWGALGAFDKEIKDGEDTLNPADYFQALAVNPNWRRFQMFNGVVSRVNKGYYNHVYSGSAKWEFLPHLYVSSVLGLSIREKESDALPEPQQGYKAGFGLRADPGDIEVSLGYMRLSKDLYHDAGYLYEKDHEYLGASFSWNKTYSEKKVRYASFSTWAYGYHKDLSLDPYYGYESGFTANLNLASRFNFLVNSAAARGPDLNGNLHDAYNGLVGCTWNKLKNFRVFGGYTYGQQLVYALSDTYPFHRFNINGWISPLDKLAMTLTGSWTRYGYPEENEIGSGEDIQILHLDNNYLIANATLEYTPTAVFKISLGSSLSTYERPGKSAALSYYGNLRYEFRPEWFAFVGVKSAQTQTEPSTWGDPLGTFRQDMNTAYAKLSVAF